MNLTKIELFKNREVKAKDIFEIKIISKATAKQMITQYHYLVDKDFMFTVAYGLFERESNELLGCATFGNVGGAVALKGWFGLDNSHSNEFLELTRLVMHPTLNGCNATSYLLGNAIKDIKKNFKEVRAIVSLADNSRHNGAVYQATNFRYYGLTDKKTDFILEGESRTRRCGTTKDKQGVWLPRSRKHRYLYIIDNSLVVNYQEQSYPKGNDGNVKPSCCDGTNKVYDRRYEVWYTCPYCSGKCERINKSVDENVFQEYNKDIR